MIGPKLFAPVVSLFVLATIKVSFSNACQNRPSQAMFICVCYVSTTNIRISGKYPFFGNRPTVSCVKGACHPNESFLFPFEYSNHANKRPEPPTCNMTPHPRISISHISIQDTYIAVATVSHCVRYI